MKKLLLLIGILFLGLGVAACDSGGTKGGVDDDVVDSDGGIIIDNDALVTDGVLSDLTVTDTTPGIDTTEPPPDGLEEIIPDLPPDNPCEPACDGPDGPMECGEDGCGGLCGTCNFGDECLDGVCVTPVNCGDGKCVEGESCEDCAVDCGKCPECGDEECNGEETCLDCPGDCGECCGDDACIAEHGEDCFTCETDCGVCCGDDACVAEHEEDCTTCAEDCGLCCGDDMCTEEHEEDCFSCPVDCGECCGDEVCVVEHEETCETCKADCGACPECGDEECNGIETCGTCIDDCPCGVEEVCFEDVCCEPFCGEKVCGSDGCGGSCGDCLPGTGCDADGTCIPAGDGTCMEIYECRVACPAGDGNCLTACNEAATVEAQEDYSAWVDCLEAKGYFDCPDGDAECFDQAFAPCEDLVEACLQGDETCGAIFDCQQACPGGDTTCVSICEFNGTLDDQDLVGQLYDCVAEQCPGGSTWECWIQATAGACSVLAEICWSEPCESLCDEYQCGYGGCNDHCGFCEEGFACSPDQQCVASQNFDCLDIYECIVACPDGDSACPPFCFDQGTVEAQADYDAWLTCLDDAGYYDCPDGDTECTSAAFQSCLPVIKACLHGELTCGEMFDCAQLDCPAGDGTCANTCFWNGTIAMQDNYDLMFDCLDTACPDGLTYTCIDEALLGDCAVWQTTCWDETCVSGCDDGINCIYGGCGDACPMTCLDGKTCDSVTKLCI